MGSIISSSLDVTVLVEVGDTQHEMQEAITLCHTNCNQNYHQ